MRNLHDIFKLSMTPGDAQDFSTKTLLLVLKISGPVLISILTVGFLLAVIQTASQIQEITLVFAVKIIVALLVILWLSSWMGSTISTFTREVFSRIAYG